MRCCWLDFCRCGGRVDGPHFFEFVKVADFRPEDVDDDVPRIDQHPIGIGHAFNTAPPEACLFEQADDVVSQSADVALGATRRNNHGIGDCRLAGQVDGHNVLCLIVVEGF